MSTGQEAAAPAAPTAPAVRRLKYRKPWIIFIPTVIAFMLLNYLVVSTETDETGKWRILPEYVAEAAEAYDNALRDHEEPPVDYMLTFERDVMGYIFKLGCQLFGGLAGIQAVWAAAWVIHMFELGVCFGICRKCNASPIVTLRYCFCTTMSGFAQLMPLRKERDAYLQETGEASTKASEDKKKN